MNTLDFIANKYRLHLDTKHLPIEIPNVGRDDLARLFRELGFMVGVEVGVEQGLYNEVLCRENPQAQIYGVDAWQCYAGYREHLDQAKMDRLYKIAQGRLTVYPNSILIRGFSPEVAGNFADGALDFVYIDASHMFEHVVADLAAWARKVHPGGIISGHDYRSTVNNFDLHVIEAVNGYTQAHRIRPWFLLGAKAVIPGQVRDHARSWFWVR